MLLKNKAIENNQVADKSYNHNEYYKLGCAIIEQAVTDFKQSVRRNVIIRGEINKKMFTPTGRLNKDIIFPCVSQMSTISDFISLIYFFKSDQFEEWVNLTLVDIDVSAAKELLFLLTLENVGAIFRADRIHI